MEEFIILDSVITSYILVVAILMIYNLLIQINVVHKQNVLDTTQKKKKIPILLSIYSTFSLIIIISRQLELQMRGSIL